MTIFLGMRRGGSGLTSLTASLTGTGTSGFDILMSLFASREPKNNNTIKSYGAPQ